MSAPSAAHAVENEAGFTPHDHETVEQHHHGTVEPHHHETVERHHHAPDDSSVVASAADSADEPGATPRPLMVDLGIVASADHGLSAQAGASDWDEALCCAFASRVIAPLDRPPRPRG